MDMCLNRGDRVVSWRDVSGWRCVIRIIRDIEGDMGKNAAPMSCIRPRCKVLGAQS